MTALDELLQQVRDEGLGELYGQLYADIFNTYVYQVEVILFAADKENTDRLENYAKSKFNSLHDEYRRQVVSLSDNLQQKYKNIITENSEVSKINFTLPDSMTINVPSDANYQSTTHLYVHPNTGVAQFKLNNWEIDVMKEEESQHDFIAWYRNPSKASKNNALKIPYLFGDEEKALCPDFLVVRKDISGYVFDILEPHSPDYADNLPKAKGLAKYASSNSTLLGRVQMIRKIGDQYVRLDFMNRTVQDAVANCTQSSDLNILFTKYGHTIQDETH